VRSIMSHRITSHSMAFLNQTKPNHNSTKNTLLVFFRISCFFCGVCCGVCYLLSMLVLVFGCFWDLGRSGELYLERFLSSLLHFKHVCVRGWVVFFASSASSSSQLIYLIERNEKHEGWWVGWIDCFSAPSLLYCCLSYFRLLFVWEGCYGCMDL
jgi:hypothetical protein